MKKHKRMNLKLEFGGTSRQKEQKHTCLEVGALETDSKLLKWLPSVKWYESPSQYFVVGKTLRRKVINAPDIWKKLTLGLHFLFYIINALPTSPFMLCISESFF